MKIKRLLRTAAILLALVLAAAASGAEETMPPSPEPPDGNAGGRPTPAPTEEPPEEIIDHIHNPELYPDFEFRGKRKVLDIWIPNITDADYAVLVYDGAVWMLDCGDVKAAMRGRLLLQQLGIEKIDVLFNSHMHHDHIDGLAVTDNTAKIGEIRICFAPDLTESGLNMIQTAEEHGIPVKEYRDGDTFCMGDGAVKLLFMKNNEDYLDINNQSAVTRITYGKRSILFTADMEKAGQEAMAARGDPALLKCDIVKYPHHGKSDLNEAFCAAMDTKIAVVTSSRRGDFGQTALRNRAIPTIFTSVLGQFLHLATDGEHWLCEYVPVQSEK